MWESKLLRFFDSIVLVKNYSITNTKFSFQQTLIIIHIHASGKIQEQKEKEEEEFKNKCKGLKENWNEIKLK